MPGAGPDKHLQTDAAVGLMGYPDPSTTSTPSSTICTTSSFQTPPIHPYNTSPTQYGYNNMTPSTSTSYEYLHGQSQEPKMAEMGMIPQSSPSPYYSPPTTVQVPIEGTISTAECYNYYGYGVTPSPSSHPHASPLSSHHSSSPIMNQSPHQIPNPAATIQPQQLM